MVSLILGVGLAVDDVATFGLVPSDDAEVVAVAGARRADARAP